MSEVVLERFIGIVCAALVVVVILVNMGYRKQRAAMTPEERKVDDEQATIDVQTW